ncbi:MAG: trypsin-like peptidase domain-containing protein [Planctomycetes bacterium]|nr:trypsin-like peptidase domain-containing protein [Planctomycetota bacterium]
MVPMTFIIAATLGFAGDLDDGVYDFTGQNCHYCRQMDPIVRKLQRANYPIRTVECEQNHDLVKRFDVATIPTFILIINGKEVERLNGAVSQDSLVRMCNRIPRKAPAAATADSRNSLGAPAEWPGKSKPRLEQEEPGRATLEAPRTAETKPAAKEKSGLTWPFTKKKQAITSSPQSPAVPRGNVDDRPKKANPVVGNPLAASVRIRIRDSKGDSYGSGTIIDSRLGRTVILTCGHIFRNWDPKAKIEVDWFDKGREETTVGKRMYHDLKADVGLITINADWAPSCRVAPVGTKIIKGAEVVTVGCSGGEKPTVEFGKITAQNRYLGSDNIEVGGMPVEGRSGGGLFTKEGLLIGVCSGADPHYKEGYYVGLKTLQATLDKCQLGHLYGEGDAGAAPVEEELADNNEQETDDQLADESELAPPGKNAYADTTQPPSRPARGDHRRHDGDTSVAVTKALQQAGEAEIVCIIRPLKPGAESRVVILNRASQRFVDYLTDELDERPNIVETSLQAADDTPAPPKAPAIRKVKRVVATPAVQVEATDESAANAPRAYRRK